jgi:diguanylate cyclase (GGDEF)-like protein
MSVLAKLKGPRTLVPVSELRILYRVTGLQWMAAFATAGIGRLLPGSIVEHERLFWSLLIPGTLYAIALFLGLPAKRPRSWLALSCEMVTALPFIAACLYATGGQRSYLLPMMVLPMLFLAYFSPPRHAWTLAILQLVICASPLLTDRAQGTHMVGTLFGYVVTYAGAMWAIGVVKRQLVAAGEHQYQSARSDPLTGLANLRAFDEFFEFSLAEGDRFVLVLCDVNYLKQINDTFGHVTGDRVLRELGAQLRTVARRSDCLARIGGDELVMIAPDADHEVAHRLAADLAEAAARVETGLGPLTMTIATAVFPSDGLDREALMSKVDADLYEIKRARPKKAVAKGELALSRRG